MSMKNWKIGTRITAGFAAVIIIAAALGIFAYSQIGSIQKGSASVSSISLPGVYVIGQIHTNTERGMRLVLQHVISTDKEERAGLETETRDIRSRNGELVARYEKDLISN